MPDGTAVDQYTLTCGEMSCEIITYGGALRSLRVPDRNGTIVDVVLGFDYLRDYLVQDKYIGALIGRYANRIGGSTFSLNGTRYFLAANDGANHLHGGLRGFDKQVWNAAGASEDTLVLTLNSPDGQEGYPGNLDVQVTYRLEAHSLTIRYRAVCDLDTPCNLINHTYFNLGGHHSGPVTSQVIQLFADCYIPTDEESIPMGVIEPVEGTPMDLRQPTRIGAQIDGAFPQLAFAGAMTTTGSQRIKKGASILLHRHSLRQLESQWKCFRLCRGFNSIQETIWMDALLEKRARRMPDDGDFAWKHRCSQIRPTARNSRPAY